MKKIILGLALIAAFTSCKKENVNESNCGLLKEIAYYSQGQPIRILTLGNITSTSYGFSINTSGINPRPDSMIVYILTDSLLNKSFYKTISYPDTTRYYFNKTYCK